MAKQLGDYTFDPQFGPPDGVYANAVVDIGASGAPTKRSHAFAGLAVSRSGVGQYSVAAPPVATKAQGFIKVSVLKSTTIFHVMLLTESPTTGAYTFETRNNAAAPPVAADPASGDVLLVEFFGTMGPVA